MTPAEAEAFNNAEEVVVQAPAGYRIRSVQMNGVWTIFAIFDAEDVDTGNIRPFAAKFVLAHEPTPLDLIDTICSAVRHELKEQWGLDPHQTMKTRDPEESKLDNCGFCLGAKGNVRGNENVYAGILVCDDCSVLVSRIIAKRDINEKCTVCGVNSGELCVGTIECDKIRV